jgi:hypothetical protein
MRLRLVTAGVGAAWESALVQACQDGAVPAAVIQRCYDLGDLLASAAAGKAEVAMVGAGVRWLDRETLARVGAAGLAVLGIVPLGDEGSERRLLQLGVDYVVSDDTSPTVLVDLARAVLAARRRQGPGGPSPAARAPVARPPQARTPLGNAEPEEPGTLVVVWGSKGAPGRTTIAINLAFESLPLVSETLLVDADTYGGSIAHANINTSHM